MSFNIKNIHNNRKKFYNYVKIVSDSNRSINLNQDLGMVIFPLKMPVVKFHLWVMCHKRHLLIRHLGVGQEKPISVPNYNQIKNCPTQMAILAKLKETICRIIVVALTHYIFFYSKTYKCRIH